MANEGNQPRHGSDNIANDPDRAHEVRKGGQQPDRSSKQSGNKPQQDDAERSGQRRGGSGNFANDPEKASESGRKGGEHSHGGR